MTTRNSKSNETDLPVQLLTTTKCPSISGSSEIRYSLGALDDEIYIKIVSSSGGGQINNSWFRFADVHKQLEKHAGSDSFTSTVFSPIFTDVSSNMAGFTLAVALKEKLVIPQEGKRRKFIQNNPAAFLAKVDKLMAAKASKSAPRRKTKATN